MKRTACFALWVLVTGLYGCSQNGGEISAEERELRKSPVTYYMSFDDPGFFEEEFIELSGRRSLEEREIDFPEGKFGSAIRMNLIPDPPDAHNMSGIDLDLVTAAMFNTRPDNRMGYTQPMLWGSGRINARLGAVAFWAYGEIPHHGLLFEQTSAAFGRTERDLIGIFVNEDHMLNAYLRDARYERHELSSNVLWSDNEWNHIVLNWDWLNGLELWMNGELVASSWGEDGWYETAPPGLFHLPTPGLRYDELYLMDRPLSEEEIDRLMTTNTPPEEEGPVYHRESFDADRLARYSGGDNQSHPVVRPGEWLSVSEVWPEEVSDGNIPGWVVVDGRNEMAWPHPYGFFTIIPGDADFHAEKVDLRTSSDARVNYMVLSGNLENVRVLSGAGDHANTGFGEGGQGGRTSVDGDPDGPSGGGVELFSLPDDHGFLYGATFPTMEGETFRIPFTEDYGSPSEYSFEGAKYRIPHSELYGSPTEYSGDVNLPLSGRKRIQNVGLYHVTTGALEDREERGESLVFSSAADLSLDPRDSFRIHAVTSRDERRFAIAGTEMGNEPATANIGGFRRLNLLTQPFREEAGITQVTLSLPVRTDQPDETLYVRVHDPALPVRLWNEFAVQLSGFTGQFQRLELTIDFQDLAVADGDRIWIDLGAAGDTEIRIGDASQPAELQVESTDVWQVADAYADKQLVPAKAQYSKMYGYMPWKFTGRDVNFDAPYAFGGAFDMIQPAQAVLRVHPEHFVANFMSRMSGPDFRGGHPVHPEEAPLVDLPNPYGAPDWALYMRDYNQKRQNIVEWWLENQNPDGQIGGGWNDDPLFMISGLKDLLYDSPEAARTLHDNLHTGLEATGIFTNGFCNISPVDRMHDADFVSERYQTVMHNLGQPYPAEREMEAAWRLGKPEQTPVNHSELSYQSARNVFHWFWGKVESEPYQSKPLHEIAEELHLYTSLLDENYLYSTTEARIHTTAQGPYGSRNLFSFMLGGSYGPRWDAMPDLAVMWPSGGGADVSRVILNADDTSLESVIYSFDEELRNLEMRLARIQDGRYRVSLYKDPEGDGNAGHLLWQMEKDLVRFDTVSLPLPSRTPLLLRVEQIEEHERPSELPDLAMNEDGAIFRDGTVTVSVSNLGNASARNIVVRLMDGEQLLQEKVISRLESAADLTATRTEVDFDSVTYSQNLQVVVNPDQEIREILSENNRVRVHRSTGGDMVASENQGIMTR